MNYESNDTYGIYRSSAYTNQGPGPTLMGAKTLIGNDVYNLQNEDIGDIKEIMLHVSSGRVEYAVLSFGSFLGLGEKLFAVPWSALKLDTVNKRFTLDMSKERLQDAPGFDKDDWPDFADESFVSNLHSYYGTQSHSTTNHRLHS